MILIWFHFSGFDDESGSNKSKLTLKLSQVKIHIKLYLLYECLVFHITFFLFFS